MAVPAKTYFCAVYNYAGKADLSKGYWSAKRELAATTHFSQVITSIWEKNFHTSFCILAPFRIIVALLSLKNAWLPPILILDFNSSP